MIKGDTTRERIKNVTSSLIHKKGYRNTSINDILDASGIKKGNLYFHYQSKELLVTEVLKDTLLFYSNDIDSNIKHTEFTEQIYDILDAVTVYHANGDTSRGCMFGNLALEIGHDGSEISLFIENVFKKWIRRFEKLIEKAVDNGELILKETPAVFAGMMIASLEGGVLLTKISGDGNHLRECSNFIKSLIEERRVK